MDAIRFPDSVVIGSKRPKGDLIHYERSQGRDKAYRKGSDSIEISLAARERFERDNLVKLERVRLKNESLKYMEELKSYISFADGDLRKIIRLSKVLEAKDNIAIGFYDDMPSTETEKMIEKLLTL